MDLRDDLIPKIYEKILLKSKNNNSDRTLQFKKTFKSAGRVVLQTEEIATRTEIETLRGCELHVVSEMVKIDESAEYLWSDIIGRKVYFEDHLIGTVASLYDVAGNVNLCLRSEQKEVDLPFNLEFFDMNFRRGEGRLELLRPPEIFSDLWVKI